MRRHSSLIFVAVLLLVWSQPGEAYVLDTPDRPERGSRCFEIGFRIDIEPYHASWSGFLSIDENNSYALTQSGGTGWTRQIRFTDHNSTIVGFARRGEALARAVKRAAMALIKHWLKERFWLLETI